MELIAGLGNPGARYSGTPHNLGFEVVDDLARRWGVSWREVGKWRAEVARRTGAGGSRSRDEADAITLAKPLTYMNLSGEAVGAIAKFYNIAPPSVLVVVDDFNLPFGRLRLRGDGSDGGHNGLKSIIQHLGGGGFPRLRIGCGPTPGEGPDDPVRYVLGRIGPRQRAWVERIVDTAADAVESVLAIGLERTMTRFNRLVIEPPDAK